MGLREVLDKLLGRSKPAQPPPVPTQPTPEEIVEAEPQKETVEKDVERGEGGGGP
jgi:hypothetical protein